MNGFSDTGLQAAQERFKTLLLGHVSKEVLGEVFRAYLEETGSVVVPREPTLDDLAMALFEIDDKRGPMREGNQVFREFYRAMIKAAEVE